jgi:hypothetical protein
MNDSEKAWELRHVVNAKYERYARTIADQLDHKIFKSSVNTAGMHPTYWEELKMRLHEMRFDSGGEVDDFAKNQCFSLLNGLPADERRVLWLGTDAVEKAEPSAFLGSTNASELIEELFDWLKDLALEQAEKEADFGAGSVHNPDIDFDSAVNSAEATPTASRQGDTMLREIVKNFAECLINTGGLRELSNELERNGMFNNLHDRMSEEETSEALYDLVRGFSLFGSSADYDLKQIMELDPHERGVWAYEQILSNISNEDSS